MKNIKEVFAMIMVCIILCGVNVGIETYGQDGKDIMGVLSYSQDTDER